MKKRVRRITFSEKEFFVLRRIVEYLWEYSIGDERPDHGLGKLKQFSEFDSEAFVNLKNLHVRLNSKRLR